MKKTIVVSMAIALSLSAVVEAKGMRASGSRSMSVARPVAAKPVQPAQNSANKADATFANTPNQAIPNNANNAGGNRLASFATGAAAGYVISQALAPNQAVANENNPAQAQQAVGSAQNSASQAVSSVPTFQSIGGQVDPFLVEKTDGYRRYCLNGVQYLAAPLAGQAAPILMVNKDGSPAQCQIAR
ncbi:hypothetical protein B0187_01110 [Haemophilus paracuniculus]|uniref:Uncharacterized protein n=1 Tax=Haemophilus paracuniculus TaxID=734 RepID=A0A1T0AUP3_9PAST|nr:hypothetical protein [Haemophilus paracuniculus]OOS00534.1 hypothetical protein B0187_01110 [Haemophilus paracuniculus]